MPIKVEVSDHQTYRPMLDEECERVKSTIEHILSEHEFLNAEISVAILDDPGIQTYNNEYLQHDWPTDVISFLLSEDSDLLEGQLLISRQTADAVAAELPWDATSELLLYAIHGTLHLLGYDDQSDDEVQQMRVLERLYLAVANVPHADKHPHFAERSKLNDQPDTEEFK